ncbi:MAG: sulfatase-like hydrolase/transferase, partial [Bacteroidota bacterium]
MKNTLLWCVALAIFLASCSKENSSDEVIDTAINPTLSSRPNILWLVAEDLSPYLPMFGDSTVETPNLSRLAAEGVCYDYFFTPAAVCAPARSAIATGLYPTHLKSNHMRTGPWFADTISQKNIQRYAEYLRPELIPYEATPAPEVKMMSEYLRKAGYYCTNNSKRDYQFISPITAWDESNKQAHFRNRKREQPFFAVFNFEVTHESRIWAKAEDSLLVAEDLDIEVPPYLPDNEIGQQDVRRMYSNIKEMDAQVGKVLDQLEED